MKKLFYWKKIIILEEEYTHIKYNIKYEAGAGRFASSHKFLLQLLKEFKLDDKLIPISNTKKYIDKSDKILKKNKFNEIFEKLNNLIKNKKKLLQ